MAAEPLPWPMIPGSPTDVALAKIKFLQAHVNWVGSMSSEVFDGVVTYSTDDYLAAMDEYSAASIRQRDRRERLAAHR
jgi:hypothetical protein